MNKEQGRISIEKEVIDRFDIKNARWYEVISWLLTFGRCGKLFYVQQTKADSWKSVPMKMQNCRCIMVPILDAPEPPNPADISGELQ
jgi:hypothetical protein